MCLPPLISPRLQPNGQIIVAAPSVIDGLLNGDAQLRHGVISLSVGQKSIFYMYKITVVPSIKMLNSQSAFMASSWPQKNNLNKA